MFRKNRKLQIGYKKKKRSKNKPFHLLSGLLVGNKVKIPIGEKIVKFMIYAALRLVIKPSKWKDPQKNFEIINRTYKRIMSSDFIYIPSSIAFYLVMSFMPIITGIFFVYLIPGFKELVIIDGRDAIAEVLGKFIPGMREIIVNLRETIEKINLSKIFPLIFFLIITFWIASGGFAKLVYTQSYLYNHRFLGGFWMNKFRGMLLVFQFTIILALALSINILIDSAIARLKIAVWIREMILYISLIISLFLLIFILFLLLYKFSPRFKVKFREILPGAMVSALPTSLFLGFFGLIANLWNYKSYGLVGAIMYLGMASLIVTYFIFMGIITNASYYKTFVGQKVPTKWTISKK